MRFFRTIIPLFLISCISNEPEQKVINADKDTVIIHDTVVAGTQTYNWQEYFGLTHDPDKDSVWFKPVSYYLDDPNCSGLARDFYYGSLRPGDDGTTDELLKLATTDNNKLRPFYRWCLDMTIAIQDGALAEHTGIPARKYAEMFPLEFFNYMDIDTTGTRYENWVSSISYSGYYDEDDHRQPKKIAARFASAMKANCKDCTPKNLARIDRFAKDCFN